jgi:polyhydroxyalkanoate synthesis regulator phasin
MKEFWAGLMSVFTSKQIPIKPFASGEEFAQSVREYVGKLKSENQDASVFVNDVWKERIDKDWREALSKNGVLGKAEYAALDEQVSELSRETVDLKFVLYIVVILLLLGAGWWFFVRKPKSAGAPPPEPPPSVPPEGE